MSNPFHAKHESQIGQLKTHHSSQLSTFKKDAMNMRLPSDVHREELLKIHRRQWQELAELQKQQRDEINLYFKNSFDGSKIDGGLSSK